MVFINRYKFLADYVYTVGKDFDVYRTPASWADTDDKPAHRFWDDDDDDENETVEIPIDAMGPLSAPVKGVSHDEKLIALSSGPTVVVFDLETKQLRTLFKGLNLPCVNLTFSPVLGQSGGRTLVIASSDTGEEQQDLFFLDLDGHGRRLDEPDNLDWGLLLELSLEPVRSEMEAVYGIPTTEQLIKPFRKDYRKALGKLQANIKSKDLVRVNGALGNFDSKYFSPDGRLCLYLIHNKSTQQGMRPPAKLPRIVVYDVVDHTQKHVLGGHEDMIMWTSFSPNGQYIASAAWDGTFRIFEAESGNCKHIIGPTRGQCWSGAWSSDSRHILLCGMAHQDGVGRPEVFVAVYDVETAQQISQFNHERLSDWVRYVAWSAKGEIAIVHRTEVLVWEPFTNKVTSSFALWVREVTMRGFAGIEKVEWVQGGDVLIVHAGDGTVEVWNQGKNIKWRIQRPHGLVARRSTWWSEKQESIVSLDGEGTMRVYRL